MEYVAFVFGVFGLMAYLEVFSLKRRVGKLETQLARTEGTDYYESRHSLLQAARSCMGRQIVLTMKEDYEDPDVISYGNTKHGSVTITDADEDWLLIRIESPKGVKDKLIRLEAVQGIRLSSKE